MRSNLPMGGSRFSVGINHRQSSGFACRSSRQPGVERPLRNGAPNTPKFSSKLQSLEAALSSLGPRDSGARVRAQLKPKPSSVRRQKGSKVEGHQVGEGFGSDRGFFRSRGRLFAEGIRKGPRGSTGAPFGDSNERMPRIYKQGRASPFWFKPFWLKVVDESSRVIAHA